MEEQIVIIVYFSGTGNSKYLAEQFAKRMNINVYSIEQNLDFETIFSHEDTIAFCYPIYGSCVPRIMREFVSKYIVSYFRSFENKTYQIILNFSDKKRKFNEVLNIKQVFANYDEEINLKEIPPYFAGIFEVK